MKIKLLSTLLLSIPFFNMAQVSLNATMAPALNSMIIYYDANVPNPPFNPSASGIGNTWDFSAITPVSGAEDTTFIVPPSTVPNYQDFPTSTISTRDDGSQNFTMMRVDANGLYFQGSVSDLAGNGNMFSLIAVPPLQAMAFPYVYGSSASATGYFEIYTTGAAISQPSIDSVHYKSTRYSQNNVQASGNMILPSGTLPAILERSINSNVDTLWMKGSATGGQWMIAPNFPQSSMDSAYHWYTNQSLVPYANALYDNTGLHDVNYYKSTVTGIYEAVQNAEGSIYPNPVTDMLHFVLPATGSIYDLSVSNASGQIVITGKTSVNALNISFLKTGLYFLKLTDSKGNNIISRFIKK